MSKLKQGVIYKITNKVNGKSYIGLTTNYNKRKRDHLKIVRNDKPAQSILYRAMRKYGESNFEWKILFDMNCHKNKLCDLEIFYIAYFNTQNPNGYNITPGGQFGDTMTNHPRIKEITENFSRKMTTIDPNTGTTPAQKIGKKVSKWRKENKDKISGHNNSYAKQTPEFRRKVALKIVENKRNTIDPKTGLSVQELASRKQSETMRKRGSVAGKKNSGAKKFLIIDPDKNEYVVHGRLIAFCNEHDISFGYVPGKIGKGPIQAPARKHQMTNRRMNAVGWSIYELKN